MSDLDRRVRQAFDEVKAPEDVKRQTQAVLDELRANAESSCAADTCAPLDELPVFTPAEQTVPATNAPISRAKFHAVRTRRALFACAACLALVVVCLAGQRLYVQPTAYVGIDVNPSVELSVNRFGLVVDARAVNNDGIALLESVSLTNRSYNEALSILTGSDAFEPYRDENSFVEISVTSDNEQQAQDLYAQSTEELASLPCEGACQKVDATTREAAAVEGMGVGRYRAALELIELDPSVTLEECAQMSMRQLRDRIAAAGGESGAQGMGNGNGSGQGAGAGQGNGAGAGQGAGNGAGQGMGNGNGGGQGMGKGAGSGQGAGNASGDGCDIAAE